MSDQTIVVLDFGGQYNHLIARRIRELGVRSVLLPHDTTLAKIRKEYDVAGIILSGSYSSVRKPDFLSMDEKILFSGIPVLGICYGMQLIAKLMGGQVIPAAKSEYGKQSVSIKNSESLLFRGVGQKTEVFMSHKDVVDTLPKDFVIDASASDSTVAAIEHVTLPIYGVQFHPEVTHTIEGMRMLDNFISLVCRASKTWKMDAFAEEKANEIQNTVKDEKVLLGLSGGVDSAVTAMLVHKAIGSNLTCVFVDHGLLRKNESDEVMNSLSGKFGLNIIRVDASDRFLEKLHGVTDPETKRKIIGNEFIKVFEETANKLGDLAFLAQGTLYTDKVESGTGASATIKSHHNVGGLPDHMNLRLLEPLDTLFKDEVRKLGLTLGLPESLVNRQPFPGPGLAIRIIGEITKDRLNLVKESDAILREEIFANGLDKETWQYFTLLPGVHTVGVMGDERTYGELIVIRAVSSVDGMTADWAKLPYDVLDKISIRIVNEVSGITRVAYDITSKPPGTIEWE